MQRLRSDNIYLTKYNLPTIIAAIEDNRRSITISPDLNFTLCELSLGEAETELGGRIFTLDELRRLANKLTGVLRVQNGEVEKLEFYADSYYKLRPTGFAPTVEIDGVRMHRTKDIDPWEDSRRKAGHVVRNGDVVLDTCGGLGYTAIWALQLGAKKVISMERNPCIIKLRVKNPHSAGLEDSRIECLEGDACNLIEEFPENFFDSAIHDPPRFSLAGELYGLEFYRHLFRVLKPKGRIFHYTGDPYSKGRGKSFLEGVMNRLRESGFEVRHVPADLGILAKKL